MNSYFNYLLAVIGKILVRNKIKILIQGFGVIISEKPIIKGDCI